MSTINNNFDLSFTGERMINHPDSDLYKISIGRYKFATGFISSNNFVLDVACGSGYGSDYLANYAKFVWGLDVDKKTLDYCRATYKKTNLNFSFADDDFIKNYQNKFDVVVSLETIEHVGDYEEFLSNIRNYLKPTGTLILSTPNNFKGIHPPVNKFHVREFSLGDLNNILNKFFPKKEILVYGQQPVEKVHDKSNFLIGALKKTLQFIYNFDKKTLNLFIKIEHTPFYKSIGRWHKEYAFDPIIYQINLGSHFINPQTSIFVVR